jgi:hypothetical protein
MERAERELLRKHALELKQQPKSLKVSFSTVLIIPLLIIIQSSTAKRTANT